MIPTKKISLTLIEYADPLIQYLPHGYSQHDLEKVLKLAATIWNACVLDQWHSTNDNVQAVRQLILRSGDAVPVAMVESLIKRKMECYSNEPRAITNECVVVKNGEFVVRAEARLDVQNIPIQNGRVN